MSRLLRVFAFAPLLCAIGPYLVAEAAGGREALAALTTGDLEHLAPALALLTSWTWATFTAVPAAVALFVWLLPLDPPRTTEVEPT